MEQIDFIYLIELALWIAIPTLMVAINSRSHRPIGFLIYAYLAAFFINHWFGALIYTAPSFSPYESVNTIVGFRESTYGLLAFSAGSLVNLSSSDPNRWKALEPREVHQLSRLYLWVGILSWIASFTFIGELPSVSVLVSAGKRAMLLVICLQCWLAWELREMRRFYLWIVGAFGLPVITILSQGFLGYGIVMLTTILSFIVTFYRPRWRIILGAAVGMYFGLSLFVVYFDHRDDIRGAVWGGQGLQAAAEVSLQALSEIAIFDYNNPHHLKVIDARLNQNELVGAAVSYTPAVVPFQYGTTLLEAIVSIIPRALWPDKPQTGGSGGYVSQHTGLIFAEGTSVGMGQILEFYINFGTYGIIIGMAVLGVGLRYMDQRLSEGICEKNWTSFALWFLVGTGALQVGGSLSEMTGTMMGGVVLAKGLNFLFESRIGKKRKRKGLHVGPIGADMKRNTDF